MELDRSTDDGIDILLVDDRPESLLALRAALENEKYNLATAASGAEALLQVLDKDFAAIVLDIQMPGMDGFEVAELIRGRDRSQHTPIIFLTAAYQSEADISRAYEVGATDYIIKPVVPEILRSKVAAFAKLHRLQRQLQRQLTETQRLNEALEETNRALVNSETQLRDLNATLERRVLERTAALQEAEQKFRFLTEAGGALAASLDYDTTLENIAHLVVPRLADWCALDLLQDDGSLRRAAALHVDPDKTKLVLDLFGHTSSRLDARAELSHVIDEGKSDFYPEITPESWQQFDLAPNQLELRREIGMKSGMIVPLTARGRTVGALSLFLASSGRLYSHGDLALAEEFARRAALALDNGRLYHESLAAVRARDHFLAVASHELKTPLTVISGYADLLKHHVDAAVRRAAEGSDPSSKLTFESADLVRQIGNIQQASARLTHLVNDLLDINHLQTRSLELSLERFDLVPLLWHVVDSFLAREQARHRSVELQAHCSAEEIWGWWDRGRVEQVMVNLIDNAIKYSTSCARVEVELGLEELAQDSRQVHLVVRDHGIGIPPEEQTKVFEPFMRATNAAESHFPGLGLGLAITRQIVERHGGVIRVSSLGLNQGTTFDVSLPLTNSPSTGQQEQVLLPPPVPNTTGNELRL